MSRGAVCVVLLTIATALVGAGSPVVGAPHAPTSARPEVVDPARRLLVVSDSVGLGAVGALPAAFGPSWQVTVVGTPAMFVEQLEATYVRSGDPDWFGDHAVVAGGYNYPYWDPARFDRSIDSMVTALVARGVRTVHWVTLREVRREDVSAAAWRDVQPYAWYFPLVNEHLERALTRHPQLDLVDWAAVADRPGITYDAIHLNTDGAALYASTIRERVVAASTRVAAGSVARVAVPGGEELAAVALNLTTTAPRATGYLSAFPCGGPVPEVSNHNHERDDVLAAAAIVPVGVDGTICVHAHDATNLVVDTTGGFPKGAGLVPLDPRRLADTRRVAGLHPAGTPLRVAVTGVDGVPAGTAALALSVTAVGAAEPGFVTVEPCGVPPTGTSTVNYGVAAAAPNLAVVAPGESGDVCVTASTGVELLVDLFAAFEPDADLELVTPRRLVDTRATGTPLGPGEVLAVPTGADGATGVLLNLTSTLADGAGYLTAFPCGTMAPNASNLNTDGRGDVANFALVPPDAEGRVCVTGDVRTHVVVDLLGSTGAAFAGRNPLRLLDTRS